MTTCRFNRWTLALAFLLLWPLLASTQALGGLSARWNDSFAEWVVYTTIEGEEGELRLRWPNQDDWTAWQYRLGESSGTIKLKWGNDLNEWEARGDNQIVTARTVWRDNFREWRITDGTHTLTLQSRYGNIWDEWVIRKSPLGHFEMYTTFEGDPRDWIIIDELDPSLSLPFRVMLAHIVAFFSSPKD